MNLLLYWYSEFTIINVIIYLIKSRCNHDNSNILESEKIDKILHTKRIFAFTEFFIQSLLLLNPPMIVQTLIVSFTNLQ
jgi:hypothetical protein